MTPFPVSVVIPLFNKAPYIRATLRSVLAQTFPPDEILIVDDGSTDGSVAAIADLIGGKVRLVTQPNAGPGPARNRGAAEARGEWVALIDGDDLWAPDHLATLAEVAHAFPEADVVATDHEEGLPEGGLAALAKADHRPPPRLIDYFAESQGQSRLWTSATAVRRSVLLSSDGFGAFYPGEDVELWVRLALDHPIAVSDARTACYVKQTGGLMDQGQQSRIWRFDLPPSLKTIERLFDPQRHGALGPSIRRYRADYCRIAARQSLYRGRPDVARQFLRLLRSEGHGTSPWQEMLARLPAAVLRAGMRMRTIVRGR